MMSLIEKHRINRTSTIKWYIDEKTGEYIVIVKVFNREVYHKRLDKKHYGIFHEYINERVKYLIGEEILNKEYSMILLDNVMYKVLDQLHFMELNRFLMPVVGLEEFEFKDNLFDIVLDATLRTGEVFDAKDLVYHQGTFYIDGKIIGDVRDFIRDGIDYEMYDLLNGLTTEQSEYLFYKMYYNLDCIKAENYVTKNVNVKIGW